MPQRFVFTFGFSHVHPFEPDFSLANHYVKAPAGLDWDEAREWMNVRFGDKWAFQYSSPVNAGVYEYCLRELIWTEDDEYDWLAKTGQIKAEEPTIRVKVDDLSDPPENIFEPTTVPDYDDPANLTIIDIPVITDESSNG